MKNSRANVSALCGSLLVIGVLGFLSSRSDFTHTHTYDKLVLKRKGFEHAFGFSLAWYRGKQDWLFLGNEYDNAVAKLKLALTPPPHQIAATKADFSKLAETGEKFGTKVVLIVGPNKSTIYPEHLPEGLVPAAKRYFNFFADELKDIPNLIVYDPATDLIQHKESEGHLYSKTDTHWNNKGAFITYAGVAKQLGIPLPEVEFKQGPARSGDLIKISKLDNFPLDPVDTWKVVWKERPNLSIAEIKEERQTSFGSASIVTNKEALSDKRIWVIGDSFTEALKQYFNASFKEVRYLGHWVDKLEQLPQDLTNGGSKPDIIFIVRVERSF